MKETFGWVVRGINQEVEKMRKGLGFVTVGGRKEVEKMRKGLSVIVGIAVLLFAYSASAAVVTDHLVSWWTFDEGTNNLAYDSGAEDNTGTLVNSPTWTTNTAGSESSWALDFDETSSQYVNCGNDASLRLGTNDFSIDMWIKTDTTAANTPVSTFKDANNRWYIMLQASGKFIGYFKSGGTMVSYIVGTSTNVNDGNWHHVAVVADRGNRSWIYIDGQDDTDGTPSCGTNNLDNTANFYVGQYNNDYFNGSIDEVRFYDKALSSTEVQDNFNAIPEPSTLLFLGAGLLGLLAFRRTAKH